MGSTSKPRNKSAFAGQAYLENEGSKIFLFQALLGIVLLFTIESASADLLKDYLWTNRVLITFSDKVDSPERLDLLRQITRQSCEYRKRDLVHIDLIYGSIDYQTLSQKFSVSPREFKLVLIGKDGKLKLYTNTVVLDDIFALIDTMPIRKKEMRVESCS